MKSFFFAGALAITTVLFGCSDGRIGESDGETEDEAALEAQGEPETLAQALTRRSTYRIPTATQRSAALAKHSNVDRNRIVPRDLLGGALAFYDINKSSVNNDRYVGVIDFGKHSANRRFFVVDMIDGSVDAHVVSHGSGSDPYYTGTASRFSNTHGSNASSRGYYRTAETYYGKHGFSLRLDGLSDTNSNARSRAVVLHAATYVDDGRSKQGRSQGCPALSFDDYQDVIAKLKGGSVIFAERAGHADD